MDGCRTSTCSTCGKRLFNARSEAKKAAKQIPGDHLIAYRCPSSNDLWHLGHPSKDVKAGLTARGSYIPGRAVKQGMAGRRSYSPIRG